MRAIFPHAGNSDCVGCWSHSPGDWGSVVANATEVQFLLGSSLPKVTAPHEGFRNLESAVAAASTVLVVEEEGGLVLNERGSREAEMEVENLVDFKAANFDSLSQGRYDMEGDGRKGELRTKDRSDSTNFQSGSHQRPIALN